MITINDTKHEIEIEKSIFITTLVRVKSAEEAQEQIRLISKKYYDATHNCYAYIINDQVMKCSDNGEPSGTAGAPMLDSLKKNDLSEVLAVTTRYFGGIKLGAGGLIRAYSKSVSEAIKNTTFVRQIMINRYIFTCDYSLSSLINKKLSKDYILDSTTYLENVSYEYLIRDEEEEKFLEEISSLTNNKIIPIKKGQEEYEEAFTK